MWYPNDNQYDGSPPQQIPRQPQPGQHAPPHPIPLAQMASYSHPTDGSLSGDMYGGMPDYPAYGDLGAAPLPMDSIPVAPPHGMTTAPQHGRPFIGGFVENPSAAPAHGRQPQFAIDVMASKLFPNPNQHALPSIPQHDDLPIPPPHHQPNLSFSDSTPNLHHMRPGFDTNNSSSTLIAPPQATRSANPATGPQEPVTEAPADTHHVGPAPRRQIRRYRTTRRVELVRGNLVLDCQVPSKLLASVERKREKEFTHMRYTAATCDPNDFKSSSYTLRQSLMGRETELFIVVTMYNEDDVLFCRTMSGIMKNIAHLCTRTRSHTWGTEGWKKVVVCIVADGRKKCDQRVLNVLASMGVYQEGIAKNMVNGKEVKAHIYEYTTQLSVDPDMKFQGADKGIVPTQILFCLKEKNQKKINSHRWFFNAFGPVLEPNVCVLLDVGTRPGGYSIYHLWKAFDINHNVGGACGEICTMTGRACMDLAKPLVAAQNFEYKMSNILDKPLESVFGYISVLPGAFSAYRYTALKNDDDGRGPLAQYFKGETRDGPSGDSDIFTANMYLAEDRILCFELVAKRHCKWVLHYVKSAWGETDVPDTLPEFISQRRRWLNGSFFAAVYSLFHFPQIWQSDHSFARKVVLHIEFTYNFVSLIFSWFALGNFYITFYFITNSLADPTVDPFGNGWGNNLFEVFRYAYIFLVIVQFICSMGNRPQGSKWMFTISVVFYAIIMAYMLFAAAWLTYQGVELGIQSTPWAQSPSQNLVLVLGQPGFRNIIISLGATYGLYLVSSFLYLEPWHMFTSFFQYLLLLPSYINILNIYAFCNIHDVSWGTKGDNSISTDLGAVVAVSTTQGRQEVDIEMPADEVDINAAYEDALLAMRKKREAVKVSRDPKTKQEDANKSFRTNLVLFWIGCNAILIAVVTAQHFQNVFSQGGGNAYLAFILWTVAALSAFRFFGSALYLIFRFFTG